VDFFREQDIARRNSRLLTLLFIAAVIVLILLTNAFVIIFLLPETLGLMEGRSVSIDWDVVVTVSAAITIVIAGVVFY